MMVSSLLVALTASGPMALGKPLANRRARRSALAARRRSVKGAAATEPASRSALATAVVNFILLVRTVLMPGLFGNETDELLTWMLSRPSIYMQVMVDLSA